MDGAAAPDVVGERATSRGPVLSLLQRTVICLRFLGKWIRTHTVEFLCKHPPSLAQMSKWFKAAPPARVLWTEGLTLTG